MEIDLETAIGGVTVYPDRALVVRRGDTRIEAAGTHTLRISGLPAGVMGDSLRATGRGPAGMRILGVERSAEYHPAAPEETLRRMREEIDRLQRELSLLQERRNTIEQERSWLGSMGEQAARSLAWGLARGTAKPEDAGAFFAYATDESQRLAASRLDLDRQQAEIQRELDARQREYANLGGGQRPDRSAAEVRVELPAPGPIEIELSYLVGGASWRPRYDARVDVSAAQVQLTQQALVSQRTGEDWHQVPLALSTARPSAAASLPDEPDPWYITGEKPAPPPAPRPMMARAITRQEPVLGMMRAASPDAPVAAMGEVSDTLQSFAGAELAFADVEQSGAAQIFRLPGSVDVPSDGSPHILGLGEHDLSCRLDYVAMPVTSPGAHLRATAANTTGRVLLPGELHIFHASATGDEFVGATRLDLTAMDAELTLYLGLDDNVTVERDLVERDTDKASILQGGVRRVTVGYRIKVGNRTATPQRILLKDRLPVPRHERVKVRVLDIKPQPSARTRLEQVTWELALAPNEQRLVEWRFVVESPTDLDLSGLP